MKKSNAAAKKQKSRRNTFAGQDSGLIVAEWLNRPELQRDDPVLHLVELTREFQSGMLDKGQEIASWINEAVAKWKLGTAEVHAFSPLDGFTWKSVSTGDPRNATLSLAFLHAVELHKQLLLSRVRRCERKECGRWFFAQYPHRTFHTDQCRIAFPGDDPQKRAARAQYMRGLRRRKKIAASKKGGK